ncbi:MAG: dTDP-4-amino-4,6-dideoxygalactose transaminase [Opitutales bacterium]|nr:dTDP-4-amino-4,6-dideoxygalactose transaminase [Opitutales bacterium]
MFSMKVDFNRLSITGHELEFIQQAIDSGHLQGGGKFLAKCESAISDIVGATSLMTTSCTTALDMVALLLDIKEGDEIIVPSYTFVSSINPFVLRGAKPVFCDSRADTLNIDETKIENLITDKTKAIVAVHYAGVACEMDTIMAIAKRRKIVVVEDTAQGLYAYYKGKHLGTFGEFGAVSFHSTKNVIAGEGGALICNNPNFIDRANFVREKGTNRIHFINGKIDKYTWVDYGSSYIPSELITAFLSAQLMCAKKFTDARIASWNYYYDNLSELEREGKIRLCKVPNGCKHNAHIFWATTDSAETTKSLLQYLKSKQIGATQHYAPLHNCPMAKKLGCADISLPVAETFAKTMFRLPIYSTITPDEQDYVIKAIFDFFKK